MSPADAAGIALNIIGFLAAGAYLLFTADERARDPVGERLRYGLMLLMALIGVRAIRWSVDWEWLRRIEEMIAAGMPIMALVLAEGLQRRHAPGLFKRTIVALSGAIALGAILRPMSLAGPFAIMLGAYVSLAFVAVAVLLLSRERQTLAPSENNAVSALAFGMMAALPFIASDFLYAAGDSVLRSGGLGLVVFVFAAARLGVSGQGGRIIAVDLAWAVVAAFFAFGMFVFAFGWPGATFATVWFLITLALTLLILIVQGLRERRVRENRRSALAGLVEAPLNNLHAFLDHVQNSATFDRIQILDQDDLRDFDPAILDAHFAYAPTTSLSELDANDPTSQRLSLMLESFSATHALLARRAPLTLLLVNAPRTGSTPEQDLHLQLLQKLAHASAQKEAP